MNRNGIRDAAGTSLMIRRACTCRNSIPDSRPVPRSTVIRSSEENSDPCPGAVRRGLVGQPPPQRHRAHRALRCSAAPPRSQPRRPPGPTRLPCRPRQPPGCRLRPRARARLDSRVRLRGRVPGCAVGSASPAWSGSPAGSGCAAGPGTTSSGWAAGSGGEAGRPATGPGPGGRWVAWPRRPRPGTPAGPAHRKSREVDFTDSSSLSMRSATTLVTPSTRSSLPRTTSAARLPRHPPVALPQARRADHVEHPGLVLQVEERDPARGRRPLPVGDHAADQHPRPSSTVDRPRAIEHARPRSSWSRTNWVGWLSGDSPVAHTSATAVSTSSMPGSVGASAPITVPGSRSGRSWAAAPAAHSASRRVSPKQAKASAVASASSCAGGQPDPPGQVGHVPVRAAPVAAIRSATSSPMVRTEDSPSRTADPVAPRRAAAPGPRCPAGSSRLQRRPGRRWR